MREPFYQDEPPNDLPRLPRQPVHVILDNIRSAYNVGSVFRTCDTGAVEHLHLCGISAPGDNKKVLKTALGATMYVPWTHHRETVEVIRLLKEKDIPVICCEVADGAVSHVRYQWPRPVAILVGNEVDGVSEETRELCDATVAIPLHGYKNALNVSVAFGIVLFEVLRQWTGS